MLKHLAAAVALLLLVFLPGCGKKSPPPDDTSTTATPGRQIERVRENSPEPLLRILHHASQEMALDGFQFDKPDLGWPRDRGSQSATDHLQALARHGYLAPEDLTRFAEIQIVNLSDSDAGESPFAKIETRQGILVIRKDGQIVNVSVAPDSDWLPR